MSREIEDLLWLQAEKPLTQFHQYHTQPRVEIRSIYAEAQERRRNGEDVHVDLMWPLKHKDFSGLHVPWNPRIIPAADNVRKSIDGLMIFLLIHAAKKQTSNCVTMISDEQR